ncbi:MAG: hypothetical protein ACKV19_03525 [Verrucomicrobiales bacterium]
MKATAQRLLRPLAALVTLVWFVVFVMDVTGLGRHRALPMPGGGRKFEARENRWLWHLPPRYARHITELTGQLTEDGLPLARTFSHREVRQHGAGRFRLHGRLVSFSPWDDSDPNKNGRRYIFHAPRPLNPWLVWGGLSLVLGAHALVRHHAPPATTRRMGFFARLADGQPSLGFFALLLGATLAARTAWVVAHPELNDGFMMARGMPYSDASLWLDMTRSIADGHGLSGPSDGQRPLYPIMLAPLLAAGIDGVLAAQGLNILLGAAAAALFGVLIAQLAGGMAGIAAAAFVALGGMQLRMLPLSMSETSGLCLLIVALALLWRGARRQGHRDLVLGGVFFGLSNLACPFSLLALPVAGAVAAVGSGRFRDFLQRGAWVAVGASLVIVPWLVRQKMVHGMATISLNGPQMLYATASPSGKYDANVGTPVKEAGAAGDPGREAAEYARLFREAVRRNPVLYGQRVWNGFTSWWLKFDPQHPALLLTLILPSTALALTRWWQGAGIGALLAAALAPPLVLAAARLDGAWWVLLAVAGAMATTDRRCWRLTGLAIAIALGCAAMNGLTSGALANRLWVMADWSVVALALLALHHGIQSAAAWRAQPDYPLSLPLPAPDLETTVPSLNPMAWASVAWIVGSASFVAVLALRGPIPAPHWPPVTLESIHATTTTTLERLDLAHRLPPDSSSLWVHPVRLAPHRAFLPARHAIGHWSRAFTPRAESRTVAIATTPHQQAATLQIPGNARGLPAGPWLAIGFMNRDPNAFLGAETELIEVLALWPLDPSGLPGPADQAHFFSPPAATRTLIPQPPDHSPGR